ncbi:hypothetical protein AVEN_140528-1, partial [Araneus ventricosus]
VESTLCLGVPFRPPHLHSGSQHPHPRMKRSSKEKNRYKVFQNKPTQ